MQLPDSPMVLSARTKTESGDISIPPPRCKLGSAAATMHGEHAYVPLQSPSMAGLHGERSAAQNRRRQSRNPSDAGFSSIHSGFIYPKPEEAAAAGSEARAASAATDKPRHLPEPADWHAGGVRHKDETMAMGTIREERSSDTARPGGEHTPRAHACAVVGERREGR